MCNFDEDPSVLNSLLDLEVLINRPVEQVWRQWLDFGSWVTSHDIEEISEAKRTIGAITRASFRRAKEVGYPLPHYHYCKIIKLVPERQYVLKTYSEKGGSYGMQMTGFDEGRFISVDGTTKVIYRFVGEYKGEAIAHDSPVKNHDDDDHMLKNLQNLKRIVESR
jgi:hypothetical protein